MEICVTMELTQENLKKLAALLPDAEITPTASAVKETPKAKTVKPAKTAAPAPEAEPEETTAREADNPAAKLTKTDIRAVALKLSKAGKQKELAAIFAKFGCAKLSDFDSRPEDYPDLMRELVSVSA